MTTWEKAFAEFFHEVEPSLVSVLPAHGCREGWLQGEVFRCFRNKRVVLYTNYLTLPSPGGLKNRKADIAIYDSEANDASLVAIAELKVYGEQGYYQKNLTGGSLAEVRRRLAAEKHSVTFSNCPRDRQLVMGSGLLADYFRLVDFVAPGPIARLLILCVRKDPIPDEFGKVLRRIEFERPGCVLGESTKYWAKSWAVGAQG